jgi:YegS/Rv2252/BmrU family lipid kinase
MSSAFQAKQQKRIVSSMHPTRPDRDAVLIVNTQSRQGQMLYSEAKSELGRKGIRLTATYPVRDASRLASVVTEAVQDGHRFLIVGGGDGSISSVARIFAGQDLVLGLLPMGTANNFARANGIPLDLSAAVEVLASGRIARVDLGRIEETYFTNAVSIGITSAVHRGSPDPLKRYLGRIGYLVTAVRTVATSQPFECTLVLDGTPVELLAYDVRVANGPFQGGLCSVDAARVDSGDLAVRVIKGPSRLNIGRVWARIGMRRPPDPATVQIFRASTVEITTTPQQYVSVDGEVLTRTPTRISVAPGALQVVVP